MSHTQSAAEKSEAKAEAAQAKADEKAEAEAAKVEPVTDAERWHFIKGTVGDLMDHITAWVNWRVRNPKA